MKKRILVSAVLFALASIGLFSIAASGTRVTGGSAPDSLLSALPKSDAIVFVDVQRALNGSLSSLLASNASALSEINLELDRFNQQFQIDVRSLDLVAVGVRFDSGKKDNVCAVALVRGRFNSSEMIKTGFAAANQKKVTIKTEEQTYNGKSLFIVTDVVQGNQTNRNESSQSFAVTALDSNTIAGGDLESVRATIDAASSGSHVDARLVQLATQTPGAIVGFSGTVPPNAAEKFTSGNDAISKQIVGIRQFHGALSTSQAGAEATVVATTDTPDQARQIRETLDALKLLGGFAGSSSKNNSDLSIVELLKGIEINSHDNDVEIRVKVAQAEIDKIVKSVTVKKAMVLKKSGTK
jgi:hypothetical protein